MKNGRYPFQKKYAVPLITRLAVHVGIMGDLDNSWRKTKTPARHKGTAQLAHEFTLQKLDEWKIKNEFERFRIAITLQEFLVTICKVVLSPNLPKSWEASGRTKDNSAFQACCSGSKSALKKMARFQNAITPYDLEMSEGFELATKGLQQVLKAAAKYRAAKKARSDLLNDYLNLKRPIAEWGQTYPQRFKKISNGSLNLVTEKIINNLVRTFVKDLSSAGFRAKTTSASIIKNIKSAETRLYKKIKQRS